MSDDATHAQLLEALAAFDRDGVMSQFAKVTRERDEYKKLAALLQEANEKLKLGLLGQKAERLPYDDAQLSLAVLRLALGLKDDEEESKRACQNFCVTCPLIRRENGQRTSPENARGRCPTPWAVVPCSCGLAEPDREA